VKAHLLLVASALLAGCSDTPSSGDIEKALNTATGACKNLEVVDVKKTNGYQDEGFYRVEYTYNIEFKDESKLKQLYKMWLSERDQKEQQRERLKLRELKLKELKDELRASSESLGPQPQQQDFGGDGSDLQMIRMSTSQVAAYREATRAWEVRRDSALAPKQQEIQDLHRSWVEEDAKLPKLTVLGREDVAIRELYGEGCSSAAFDYVRHVFPPLGNLLRVDADGKLIDPAPIFEFKKTQVKGVMPMRKTENGWRKI
jgi:flavin-binding protein dodecin